MKVLMGSNPAGVSEAILEFANEFEDVTFVCPKEREDLASEMADADIYVGWMSRELFLAGKQLKWVQSPSSGINYYLAIPELVEGEVLLTSARGPHAACVAESTLAMILSFTRGVREAALQQQKHAWQNQIRGSLRELTGSVMGSSGSVR